MREAIERDEFALARTLDRGFLAVLIMADLPGKTLPSNPSTESLARAATEIARLHASPVKRGVPDLAMPGRPPALSGLARQYVRALERAFAMGPGRARVVRKAIDVAEAHARESFRRQHLREVVRPCHGDLRFENILDDGVRARLIDFDYAGLGDPAVDLAMFASRMPLSSSQELRLLDACSSESRDRKLLDRYFALKPLVALTGALGALLDLDDVRRGLRKVLWDLRAEASDVERNEPASENCGSRVPRATLELSEATRRVGLSLPAEDLSRTARARIRVWVTIDGTAASQKTPLARALAAELELPRFNTGAIYRYSALVALERGLSPSRPTDVKRLIRALERREPKLCPDGALAVGSDVLSDVLDSPRVELQVAEWAALPELRAFANACTKRALACGAGVVEGRDAHRLVKRATLKLFVDAPIAARARWLAERSGLDVREARARIEARDARDRNRALDPLILTKDMRRVEVRPESLDTIARRLADQLRSAP